MKQEYTPLSTSDEISLATDSEEQILDTPKPNSFFVRNALHILTTSTLLFLTSTTLLLFRIITHVPSETECLKAHAIYSPLTSSIRTSQYNFDNPFTHQTPYRGTPTNELEAAWETLWNHDLISIPSTSFSHLNKSSSEEYMHTPDGVNYAANIEVFHQLHCLNLIRQYTYLSYYNSHEVQKPSDMKLAGEENLRIHVDHCIETLRLNIMCQGDVTPYIFIQGSKFPMGTADFNANHKCRDFNGIVTDFERNVVMPRWDPKRFGNRQYVVDPWREGRGRGK